jgi:uncharacterized protein (DUF983 family)
MNVRVVKESSMTAAKPGAPLAAVALRGRCPRCGIGRLFNGYLTIAPTCTNCGLSYAANDTADGPAFFIMLPLCIITAVAALVFELKAEPPLWLHIVIWPLFIAGVIGLTLRPVKALMVALQYRYRDVEDDSRNTTI